MKTLRSALLLGSCLLLCLAGCGSGGHSVVKGKVTKDGKPLEIGKKQLRIIFIPEGDKATTSYPATVDQTTGAFELKGPDNTSGIPPGKYKVTVELIDHDARPGGKDYLEGKYNDKNSKLVKDVDGKSEVILDL